MSSEFIVNPSDNIKKAMWNIKQNLKNKNELSIISGVSGSFAATKVCDNLVRLKYVTIDNITTTTSIIEGKRRISINILIKKTSEFERLYEENEEKRREIIATKEKAKSEKKDIPENK